MCQIQIIKKIKGRLTEKDKREFIKLMSLGNLYNNDAFGIFNHNYSVKSPGDFDYKLMNESKIKRGRFIVGHNRLATTGECFVHPKDFVHPEEKINMDSFGMNPWGGSSCGMLMNPRCMNPYRGWWKGIVKAWKSGDEEIISKNYNNHPFKLNGLSLVHNGTVINSKKLRKKYKIDTQIETDSYIILHLINYFLDKSEEKERVNKIIDAIKQTTKELDGNYSVILYDKLVKEIFYFRNEFTSFTFDIINKDLIIGSTKQKNLNYVYEKDLSRKRIPTYPGKIYSVGDKVKIVGMFNIDERGYSRNGKCN